MARRVARDFGEGKPIAESLGAEQCPPCRQPEIVREAPHHWRTLVRGFRPDGTKAPLWRSILGMAGISDVPSQAHSARFSRLHVDSS